MHAYLKEMTFALPIPVRPPSANTSKSSGSGKGVSFVTAWEDSSNLASNSPFEDPPTVFTDDSSPTSPETLLKELLPLKTESLAVTPVDRSRPRPRPKGTPHPNRVKTTSILPGAQSGSDILWSTPSRKPKVSYGSDPHSTLFPLPSMGLFLAPAY